jgi:glycosyltransferase involved in cell wall biosynthesis
MHVINCLFDDRYGGAPKRVVQVAESLARYGVKTTVCLPEGSGNAADAARESGVPVLRLGFGRIPRPSDPARVLRWMARFPRDVGRFVNLFRRERPDVVHVNGAFFLAPALAAKLAGIPLVWHLNDTVVSAKVAPVLGTLVRILADRVVTSSEAVAVHYGVARTPHEVVHVPVDPRCYGVALGGSRRRGGVPRIGLVANWNPLKGVEYFVRTAALVREELGDGLEVVFAGARLDTHADYARSLDDLISELGLRPVVRELGFVSSVADVLADLDVLVMTSISEASSMPVLEAMAAGLPVVAANVGGVPEILAADPDRPAGILVPPRHPEAMATAVLKLLQEPDLADRMGHNGYRLAKERFSLEVRAQQHLELYKGLAGEAKR